MKKLSRALAITLLAASIPATIVMAQQTESDQPAVETSEKAEKSGERRGPSPETLARLEDGRIAMAKGALKLTPEQEKLWAPVEEKIRAGYAERRQQREARREKRDERRADREKGEKLSLPDRVERASEKMAERASKLSERAAKTKEFAGVLKPFYESLSDEQKEVASHVLSRFAHEGRGRGRHGRRWAMGGGRHHGRSHDRQWE
jgi:hypothetical protein